MPNRWHQATCSPRHSPPVSGTQTNMEGNSSRLSLLVGQLTGLVLISVAEETKIHRLLLAVAEPTEDWIGPTNSLPQTRTTAPLF